MARIVSKSYAIGDVIITSHPMVHALNPDLKGSHCDHCIGQLPVSSGTVLKCSHCKLMYYCDRKCYENDKKYHNLIECNIYKRYYGKDYKKLCQKQQMFLMVDNDTLFRVLLRLLLLIKSDPSTATKSVKCHNGRLRCLNDLVSHAVDIKNDNFRYNMFEQMYEKLQSLGVNVCKERVLCYFGQIAVNGYEYKSYDVYNVQHYSDKFLGFGLFIPLSIYDHSCQPNAAYVNTGNSIQFRAMRPIAENELIFVDYIPLERSKSERKKILKSDWYFDCMCGKCGSISDNSVNYKLLKNLSYASIERQQLSVLIEIYSGFHPAHSLYLLAYLDAMLSDSDSESVAKDVEQMKMIVKINVKITHGFDHEIFKFLKNII